MSFPEKKKYTSDFQSRQTSAGATLGEFQGSSMVLHYGDAAEEAARAVSEWSLLEFPEADILEVYGKHAERFLHGLVTSDIKGMPNQSSAWSTALNRKGRLVSDFTVWRTDERTFRLIAPAGRGIELGNHLLQHKVAERVEIEWSEKQYSLILAIGPKSPAILGSNNELGEWDFNGEIIAHGPGPDLQLPTRALLVESASVESVWASLVDQGARPMGTLAFDALRVEAGHPVFGIEALEDRMPIEVGMDATVSFLKGCYVGQEVIAMATYRGHPNRKLMGVRFPDETTPPEAGQSLSFENGKKGILTTSSIPPRLNCAAGLAVVHYSVAEAGTQTWIQSGEKKILGELVDLPQI